MRNTASYNTFELLKWAGIFWVGIFRVGVFQGRIFLEPFCMDEPKFKGIVNLFSCDSRKSYFNICENIVTTPYQLKNFSRWFFFLKMVFYTEILV